MNALEQARIDVIAARETFTNSLIELRSRSAPHELAEDALQFLDPDLSMLARIKARVTEHRVASIALLAGLAWLASPRRAHGASPPTTKKEKTHDSGQRHHHHHRPRHGSEVPRRA